MTATQDQFLTVLARDEAVRRWRAALDPRPLGVETVALAAAQGRVLAEDVAARVDAPPFDRSLVDGFALAAVDVAGASESTPVRLALTGDEIACGRVPQAQVGAGRASLIATGGPIPRGADAVVMVEHTDVEDGALLVRRAVAPGQNLAFAGSDIALGQTVVRRGTLVGAREIGMLAAAGAGTVRVLRRPRIGVLSTGDELVAPGAPLPPAAIYDSNGPIIAAALVENGCEPVALGVVGDDEAALWAAMRAAHAELDGLILSGGTSKSAGDLNHRLVGRLGAPGIIAHGVALKPGKPLCLAVAAGKPVVVLPGFPTSAMFTFHDVVAPQLREIAGLPPRDAGTIDARLALRAPSERGRTEYVMVALARGADGLIATPTGKGSGAVSSFAEADGFFAIDALDDEAPAGAPVSVTLFARSVRVPDLVITGSHCVGLDAVIGRLIEKGLSVRTLALGSMAGLQALARGDCDAAPIHLLDPASERYNLPYLQPGQRLIAGWRRLQGLVFRPGDARFEGRMPAEAIAAALADPACIMVSRNAGAGTRVLIDRLLAGARPPGFWNQPKSHNAVVAAVAQGRADWGIAIAPLARAAGLRVIALGEEHYDIAVGRESAAIAALEEAIGACADALESLGFTPAAGRP